MFQLILQSMKKRPVQTTAHIVAVAISVAMVFALFLVQSGVTNGIAVSQERLGADIMVIPEGVGAYIDQDQLLFTGEPLSVYVSQEYLRKITEIDGVDKATGQFFATTMNASCCSADRATRIIGFDPATDYVVTPWLAEQDGLILGEQEVVVGSDMDMSGGTITIMGQPFQMVRQLDPTGTSLDYSILMNITVARRLMAGQEQFQHLWDKYGNPEQLVSVIMVKVDPEQKARVEREIKELPGIDVITTSEHYKEIASQMQVIFQIMLGAIILAILSTVIQLLARFFTMVWERKGEWGLYRALGASMGDLKKLILGEAMLLVGIGVMVGLALGFVLYKILLLVLAAQSLFPFVPLSAGRLIIWTLAIIVGYLLFAVIASWYPMAKSSKIDPASAIALGSID